MEHCPCQREVNISWSSDDGNGTFISTDGAKYTFSHTTCSSDAFERGPGQKVVGFSFYGTPSSTNDKDKHYFEVRGKIMHSTLCQ